MKQRIIENVKGFDCEIITESKAYNEAYDNYINIQEKKIPNKVKKKFSSVFSHLIS